MAENNGLPNPQSYEQILSDMLSAYAAKQGINDFNVGSAVTSFFEVVALATARSSGDVFQILRDFSVDRATGDALKRLATENRVTPITAKPATGLVTVIDSSFQKIQTKVYAGANPPNIGSTVIKVSDASLFPGTGSIYIGRGTPNVEGPLAYTSITPVGGFFEINLSVATAKFHNVGETVILAQGGNRSIPANTIALSPASGASPDIQYSVVTAAVILDGETTVENVQVSAQTPGASGNVPRGAIKTFATPPFGGATVTNALPFTTGADSETDEQLRVRIKRALASIGLGTPTAIKAAVKDATASDEPGSSIVSSSIVSSSEGSILFIDDGKGYEAKSAGVGLEAIIDSALGGEQYFQLATGGRQAPVAKAFLQTTLTAPFDLIGGDTLAVTVGEVTQEHVFDNVDFRSPGGATAFEVTASINANTVLNFEATTAEGGQYVVIRSKNEGNDTIKTATPTTNGRNAAAQLGFPSNEIQTLRLYKNKIPLSKDGKSAALFTQNQQLWSATIVTGDTLILSVDGTAFITYTVTDADFIATGLYTQVAATNSLDSWQQVLNAKLTGVTVTIVGTQLEIKSNLGASNRAQIVIDPSSTLVTKGMFSQLIGLSAAGKQSDYILDRNTAQFKLVEALAVGDQLTAGSDETEARISSEQIPGGSITFSSDAHVWILVDNPGEIIPVGVAGNTILAVSKPSANVVRYTSTVPTAFQNVLVGDYVIIWSEELVATNRLEGRVNARTNSTLDILVTPAEYAAAAPTAGVLFSEGFIVVRTTLAPQKFRVTLGNKTLDQIATELQAQTNSLIFTVQEEQYIIVRSRTKDEDGYILIVTADAQGKLLALPVNQSDVSKDSLIAFYESDNFEASFPLFIHAGFASGSAADPIDSYITSFTSSISLAGRDPNELIALLHPYGVIRDTQPAGEYVQELSIAGAVIGIENQPLIRRLRDNDRYYIANPLDFGSNDTAVVIVDNDTSSKSFEVPFYRRAITNTSNVNNPNNFNAYDVDSGPTANFSSAFGSTFDFSEFKALMQARKVLKPTPPNTAILYRAARWGRSGEKINVGYTYPSVPNADVSSVITSDQDVDIRISLKSGPSVATSIDASTEWNISVTANTPSAGIDQVTYTWNGTGSAPALGGLSGGEFVNIQQTTEFDERNTGIFRVSTEAGFLPTATSFSVQRANGAAVAESDRATLVGGAITFYDSAPTLASEVDTYVNANLTDFITSTLIDDPTPPPDGSGTIVLSTYEDSGFTYESVYLLDGINWIAASNLGGTPNFTFKVPLANSADGTYQFNEGEEVRLIPTTMDQVRRLISVLAVTGFTTVGTVGVVDRGTRLELATNTLGSDGSIQIIGGLANDYTVPVLDSATRIDNSIMSVSTDKVSAQGIHSDQWFRLQATFAQRKEALMSSNTSITVLSNQPAVGQSTVKLLGRVLTQRYFGRQRHHIRTMGRTFRVEKQGSLACLSWNGQGVNPTFLKAALNFNDAGGGTVNVSKVTGTGDAQYTIITGDANFNELSIGDLLTVDNMAFAANNGTFLVTGVSSDGQIVRVLNPDAEDEFSSGTFTFSTNSTAGDAFTIGITTLLAGTDFAIGATQQDTAANLSAVIGTLPGVTSVANGSVVTVTATSPDQSTALAYAGVGTVTVSSAFLVGTPFVAGDFSASSEVSEGDTMVVGAPFAVLNQGKFRVIRRYDNSVWFENSNVIEEEVNLPLNPISFGYDATTSFQVNATDHSIYLNWNGVGTEPNFANTRMGDIITLGVDFDAANQGNFMVQRSGAKLQEITDFVMPAGSNFTIGGAGTYFLLQSAGDVNLYYVWFNVNTSNSDPAVGGRVGLEVQILSGDTATTVAAKAALVIGAATGLTASAANGVTAVTTTGFQETTNATNFNVPAPFTVNVTQEGRRTFLEAINPSAVNESAVFVTSGTLQVHRPQIQFSEYEATVAGDLFVATGDTLTTPNAGSYVVAEVIDRDTIVVTGTMASVTNVSLNGRETSVYMQEGVFYTGYKHVSFATQQPGAPTRSLIVFDTNAQYSKINESAGVLINSLNKMDFNTTIRKGLDSYRYNTGLIAEANRIIYGDPRDPTTYPGVGAAGAEIFSREPLTRRIQVSIDVRINTGVPFAQTAEQVRTSVSSLINSNDVGEPIAISAIVGAVNSIPGVRASAISSPQYDSTHDLIFIAPSEKARILDPVLDISVSQIGT
ncbi:MAG: hypothetical protein HC840_00800 [Leptolyngbyaceae cyanobacterium RM2_2_4]|nr:hypothetical protein [Leptolyngbyaceae cyanobacterium RM2_2_4]